MSFVQRQHSGRGDKKTIYVVLSTSIRTKGKKHPRQTRVHLGCLCEDETTVHISKAIAGSSHLRINLQLLKEKALLGKTALMEWIAQQVPATAVVQKSLSDVPTMVKRIGPVHIMRFIAHTLGLEDILCATFNNDEFKDGLAILYLAMHQVAESRPLYQAHLWMDEQEIPDGLNGYDFSSAETSNLTMRIGSDNLSMERFFKLWIQKLGRPSSLIFDTTSVSSHSEQLDWVEWGYNRDGDELPQVNISLVSARQSRLPIYYRMLPGSIPDVSSLKITLDLLKEHGITDFTTSLDRGFYSAANIRNMINQNIGFVLGVPHSCKQTTDLIAKHRSSLRSPKRSLSYNGHVIRHAKDVWKVDMGKNELPKELAAHVFWDYARQSEQEKAFESRVFLLESKAKSDAPNGFTSQKDAILWLKENAKKLSFCLKIYFLNDFWHVERKPHTIALAVAKKGFTVVITTKLDAQGIQIIDDYRSRDIVEKLFDTFKNENSQNRLRSGNRQAVNGRLFIAFIALILHAEIENRMRKNDLLKRYTVTEVLAIMRKLERVKMESGNSYLLEITKSQREILEKLAIPAPV
jgi:transposase